jgi:hypothetical protein
VPLITVNKIINNLSNDIDLSKIKKPHAKLNFKKAVNLVSKLLVLYKSTLSKKERRFIKQTEEYKLKIKEYEEKSMRLEPKVEDRIICIQNEQVLNFYIDAFNLKILNNLFD